MVLNLFGQAFALFDADESILIICRDLSYNNLSGPLPPNIGSLSNLESLGSEMVRRASSSTEAARAGEGGPRRWGLDGGRQRAAPRDGSGNVA